LRLDRPLDEIVAVMRKRRIHSTSCRSAVASSVSGLAKDWPSLKKM
jgi:hypothetical protein